MAGPEVGSVYIRVKAITDKVAPDIQKAFAGLGNDSSISKSGADLAGNLNRAISKNLDPNVFSKIGAALGDFGGEAGSAREKLYTLTRGFNIGGTGAATLIGALSSLVGGLGGLAGAALGAAPAVMGLVGAFVSLKVGIAVGEMALNGIAQAVQKSIAQQSSFGLTLAETARKMRDLQFASEDAALAEKRAALDLEKARNNLVRTQDMPASSMARREALQAYKEAELNLRKAKAKNKDAASEAKDGPKSPKAGNDPFAGLTPSQKDFAEFLISIQGKMKELTEEAAKGFLPTLQKNINTLLKEVFPTFKKGIGEISTGLAGLTTNVTNALADPANVKLLGEIMHEIAGDLPIIGEIIGSVYGMFLSVLKASHPLVKNFLNFLKTKFAGLDAWLKTDEGKKKMEAFFLRSEEIMKDLGIIFDNTLGGLGAIIGANFEPGSGGDIMIQWLKDVTGKWAEMDDTVEGKNALKQYFIDTAINTTKILDSVGALVEQLLLLGANPAIGQTFDALAKGAPDIGKLAGMLVDAGPSMGEFVANVVEFITKMTDTKAITNFFDTMSIMVEELNKALENPMVNNLLTGLGQLHGILFGIIGGTKLLSFGFEYVGETVDVVKGTFTGIADGWASIKTGFEDTNQAIDMIRGINLGEIKDSFSFAKEGSGSLIQGYSAATTNISGQLQRLAGTTKTAFGNMAQSSNGFVAGFGKLGGLIMGHPIIAAIAAIVAIMVILYNTSDEFRKFVDEAFGQVLGMLSDAWKDIQKALEPLIAAFDELMTSLGIKTAGAAGSPLIIFFEAIVNVVKMVLAVLIPLVTFIVTNFVRGFTSAITILSGVIKIIKGVIDWVSAFFKALVTGKWDDFAKASDKAWKLIKSGAMQILSGIVNYFIDGINNIIRLANGISGNIKKATGGVISLGTIKEVQRWVPKLAKGGTVMPTAGGTLALVAEAGRPERVEPLDANGLSNRDKSLIEFLSKGSSNGGQPIQMNIYPSAGMDEKDLAAVVSRQLAFELRRGGY